MSTAERSFFGIDYQADEAEYQRARSMLGASLYRSAEQDYFGAVFDGIDIDDEEDYTEEQKEGEKYYEAVRASKALHEMRGLERTYGLLIGGKEGKYRYGNVFPYDPEVHQFGDDPEDLPPLKGEKVMVFKSEIAGRDGRIWVHPELYQIRTS